MDSLLEVTVSVRSRRSFGLEDMKCYAWRAEGKVGQAALSLGMGWLIIWTTTYKESFVYRKVRRLVVRMFRVKWGRTSVTSQSEGKKTPKENFNKQKKGKSVKLKETSGLNKTPDSIFITSSNF